MLKQIPALLITPAPPWATPKATACLIPSFQLHSLPWEPMCREEADVPPWNAVNPLLWTQMKARHSRKTCCIVSSCHSSQGVRCRDTCPKTDWMPPFSSPVAAALSQGTRWSRASLLWPGPHTLLRWHWGKWKWQESHPLGLQPTLSHRLPSPPPHPHTHFLWLAQENRAESKRLFLWSHDLFFCLFI